MFAGPQYYPDGGMSDFITSSDEIEPLQLPMSHNIGDDNFRYYTRTDKDDDFNWYHIFDSAIGRVIEAKHLSGEHDLAEDQYHFTAINGKESS